MAILQVRDIDDRLYESLKHKAGMTHRSISQEVIVILKNYLLANDSKAEAQTLEFLKLSNSWIDARKPNSIVKELRNKKVKSQREKVLNELFD